MQHTLQHGSKWKPAPRASSGESGQGQAKVRSVRYLSSDYLPELGTRWVDPGSGYALGVMSKVTSGQVAARSNLGAPRGRVPVLLGWLVHGHHPWNTSPPSCAGRYLSTCYPPCVPYLEGGGWQAGWSAGWVSPIPVLNKAPYSHVWSVVAHTCAPALLSMIQPPVLE